MIATFLSNKQPMKTLFYRFIFLFLFILTACQHSSNITPTPEKSTLTFHGTDIHKEKIGGDFTLTNADGNPFSLNHLKGKVVILTFGFSHCPDVCPTELITYNDVYKQLGAQAKDIAIVFISLDPERDTPALIGRYVAQFNPQFIGLTATPTQNLDIIKQQYHIISAKTEVRSPTSYNIDHSSGTYLIDKKGNARVFEPYGTTATDIAHDVEILLQ